MTKMDKESSGDILIMKGLGEIAWKYALKNSLFSFCNSFHTAQEIYSNNGFFNLTATHDLFESKKNREGNKKKEIKNYHIIFSLF